MKILCNYYVTLRCNSQCKFCAIWGQKPGHDYREQTLVEVENNLRGLKKLGIRVIDFTGGEPLLYPELRGALLCAKKLGFYTTVTTNCILYPQYAENLRGLIDVLYFSLHSQCQDQHDETAGVCSYTKVITSIKIAKELGQKIYLLHTVTNDNIGRLPDMLDFAQKNRCVLSINPCFSYFGNTELKNGLARQLKKYFAHPYVMLNLALLKFINDGGNQADSPVCQAVKNTVVISPDNYLLLPCYHHSLHKIKIENNLFELHNSSLVQNVAKQVGAYQFCQGCKINCYMRASLYKKYPFSFMATWLKNWLEMARK